jgi:hypothetical protein
MDTPELPWYQFSLRSLFLLTLLVAILCSIGVSAGWFYSFVVLIGVPLGITLVRAKAEVFIYAVRLLLIVLCGYLWLCFVSFGVWKPIWLGALVIAVLAGGVYEWLDGERSKIET